MKASLRFRVRWTQTAEADLAGIVDSLAAAEGAGSAMESFERLSGRAAELQTMPERGRIVPELLKFGIRNYREILPSPWRIIYRMEQRMVFVTAVLDGTRGLEDSLLERIGRS